MNLLAVKPTKKSSMMIWSDFFPNCIIDYCIIQSCFETSNFEFFSLAIKSERSRKVILKGIPKYTSVDEVNSELVKLRFSVHPVAKLKKFENKLSLLTFPVNLFSTPNVATIFLHKILSRFITVETYFKGF